jgi:hypothetical protein
MKTNEFIVEYAGIGEDATNMSTDHEVQMARADCYTAAKYAIELHKLLKNVSEMHGLDGWVSEKLTLANDYLRTVHEYLTHEMAHPQEVMPEMFTAESAEIQFAELLGEGVAEAGPGDINRLEHRGAEYNVYFNQRKGMYTARGKGQMSGQIQPEWFHTLADAMDHAEMEIGGYDEHDGVAEAGMSDQHKERHLAAVRAYHAKKKADKEQRSADSRAAFGNMLGGSPADLTSKLKVRESGVAEERTETKNEKGEVTSWRDEGEWKKSEKKDPRGRVTNMSDRARRSTEKTPKTPVKETTSSAVATTPGVGKGPETGTLFGGSYAPKTPFTAKKKTKTSVIKR